MSATRQKRLERAQLRVLFQTPFFAPGLAKLPVIWDSSIPTACTNGQQIRWSPEFFDSLTDQQIVTVLAHEVCHCMLGHLWRAPGGVDWQCWNEATDHAVNLMLKEFAALVTAKNLADPFPFPEGNYCADPAFAGLSEEHIYENLSKRPKQKGGGSGGMGKGGKTSPGSNQTPSIGEMEQPDASQAASAANKRLANDWDGTLMQAAKMASGRGDCPQSINRLIDKMVTPQVPWWDLLRSWLREQCSDDWCFQRPAMEYSDGAFIMPSLHSERIGPVVMGRDSSGSISDDTHARFTAEQQSCLDEMRPAKLVDIHCDTAIHHVAEYTPGDTVSHHRHCGGGTDFRPIFEHVANMAEQPKCLVILTDLDGAFPDKAPSYPVLWVSTVKDGKAPFGETVFAGE